MEYVDIRDIPEFQEAQKRNQTEPKKTLYCTPGYGYEEDIDFSLEGEKCECGGTLQHQRRHVPSGTREGRMVGGTGRYNEITYQRVETVICDTCGAVHDLGIYHAWKEERRQQNPFAFFADDLKDSKPE